MPVADEYVRNLPEIYRDILAAFPEFSPTRKAGYGLSFPSLYSALDGRYTLGEIELACEQMARAGVMEIKHTIFATPTPAGEELSRGDGRQSRSESWRTALSRTPHGLRKLNGSI